MTQDILEKSIMTKKSHYFIDGFVSQSKTIPILAFDITTKKYYFL